MSTPKRTRRARVGPRRAVHLDDLSLPRDGFGDDALLRELRGADLDLAVAEARLVDVEACVFTTCALAGSRIAKLSVSDTVLERCDLANVDVTEAAFSRVEVIGSRLTGARFGSASLRHVLFADCVADISSFRFATGLALEFVDCGLQGADFSSADLRGATFRGCDLTGVDFSLAQAGGALFVNCTWGENVGVTSLVGATVADASPVDTLAFTTALATGLGVALADPADLDDGAPTSHG